MIFALLLKYDISGPGWMAIINYLKLIRGHCFVLFKNLIVTTEFLYFQILNSSIFKIVTEVISDFAVKLNLAPVKKDFGKEAKLFSYLIIDFGISLCLLQLDIHSDKLSLTRNILSPVMVYKIYTIS